MTRRQARRFGGMVILWFIAMGVIIQFLPANPDVRAAYMLGYAFASALAIVAIAQLHRRVLPQLRKAPLYVAVGVTALLYMGSILLATALGMAIMVGLASGSWDYIRQMLRDFFSLGWPTTVGIPFLVALGILFLVEISRRVGPGRLLSLMLGRYRNPREETRLFLLIDLVGSTSLAEQLGSVRYSTFLRDFFADLTEPVIETGGEIVEYVGDEAVVTWPFRGGQNSASALRCFQLFKKLLISREPEYEKNFGAVPKFKAALHAGPVVATEVGQIRSQLVFHGDALNTASRVLGECNAMRADLLVTEIVAKHLLSVPGSNLEPPQHIHLRGKGEPVSVAKVQT